MRISKADWQQICDDLLIQNPAAKSSDWQQFDNNQFEAQIFSSSSLRGVRKMGAFSIIRSGADISNLYLGRFCAIGAGFICAPPEHPLDWAGTSSVFVLDYDWCKSDQHYHLETTGRGFTYKPVRMGSDVWIGRDVYIKGGVSIGDGAVVAANSVVTKDVPPYAIVGGNPARVIRYRFDEQVIARLLAIRWWDHDPAWTRTVDVSDIHTVIAYFEENGDKIKTLSPAFVKFTRDGHEIGRRGSN